MTRPSVIVVEDDASLRTLTVLGLREEGYRAEGVGTAGELLRRLERDEPPDALIIDVGLPDADGRDLCQVIRVRGFSTPVLFLTARDALPDRLAGFSAGGDDYLTKPHSFAELAARLQALVRRGGGEAHIEFAGLRIDPATHTMTMNDVVVDLTPTEFRLLAELAAHPGEAVRRRALARAGWPHGAIVNDNTLDSYIARLRRKLAIAPNAPAITTVHHVGYRLT